MELGIHADLYALDALANYQNGKLLHQAWLTRGLVTTENLAQWCFGGDLNRLKKHMEGTKGALQKMMRLIKLEEQSEDTEEVRKLYELAVQKSLEGERTSVWCIQHTDGTYHPLPPWTQTPITHRINHRIDLCRTII